MAVENETDVQKLINSAKADGKLLIGANSVRKALKNDTLEKVICSSNCSKEVRKDFEHYTKLSKVPLEYFSGNSSRLGETCGKPFNVLIIGINK